jgi:[ribosomal protein S5]-alanine N-acetyltransferase
MGPMTVIRTRRLTLRPARTADIPAMFEIMSNPDAMAYWSTLPHSSIEQTARWTSWMIDTPKAGVVTDFMVEFEGQVIGTAGFSKPPEIGYILHPAFWSRGFGREAVSAAIGFGFEALDLTVIEADVDPRNTASLRLLEKLGFRQTGYAERTFKLGDHWADSVYLALTKDNFRPHLHPED